MSDVTFLVQIEELQAIQKNAKEQGNDEAAHLIGLCIQELDSFDFLRSIANMVDAVESAVRHLKACECTSPEDQEKLEILRKELSEFAERLSGALTRRY